MVTIVTGKVNAGKTSFLLHYYQKHGEGDGFISRKILVDEKTFGFTSIRLSSKEEKPWMIHDDFYQNEFIHAGRVGPYCVNLDRLKEIENAIGTMIAQGIHPIYLDEIGRLELSGKGYDPILRKLLASHLDIIIAVREDLTPLIIEHYRLVDYSIIPVNQ